VPAWHVTSQPLAFYTHKYVIIVTDDTTTCKHLMYAYVQCWRRWFFSALPHTVCTALGQNNNMADV